ncbi:MAG: O-sialoglycoprotein endopeptidase [Clostridia bacterium]
MRVVLGFDTSCYTTSAAVVDEHGKAICSSRLLLPVEAGKRGLRQSEAVFAHVRQMPLVMDELSAVLKAEQVVAVCASCAPRDEPDSYMPVFTVGLGHAKVLASALHVPLYLTSHQRGHIAAGLIGNEKPKGPFVALHLSGGTTELLRCEENALTCIGGSADLHAGQLVDRIGVAMGLPFPAGPALEKLALTCTEPTETLLGVSMEPGDLRCHFSGAEAQAQRLIAQGVLTRERIAAEVFDLLARTVARLLKAAAEQAGVQQALVVGGVASSALLRELVMARLRKLRAPLQLLFGQPQFSADNAAGVASIGMEHFLAQTRDL